VDVKLNEAHRSCDVSINIIGAREAAELDASRNRNLTTFRSVHAPFDVAPRSGAGKVSNGNADRSFQLAAP
jgi:hypothetical protein